MIDISDYIKAYRSFRCDACHGSGIVVLKTSPGRTIAIQPCIEAGPIEAPVPDDLPVPTCDICGEIYFDGYSCELMSNAAEELWLKTNGFSV